MVEDTMQGKEVYCLDTAAPSLAHTVPTASVNSANLFNDQALEDDEVFRNLPDLWDHSDSEDEDGDFEGEETEDEEDSGDEKEEDGGNEEEEEDDIGVRVSNKERASILPAKFTKHKRTQSTATSKKNKKRRNAAPDETEAPPATEPIVETRVERVVVSRSTKNPAHYFFKKLDPSEVDNPEVGTAYYQSYHGNKKILKITAKMKHSLNGLIGHLETHFKPLHRLYLLLKARSTPPTEDEILVASGQKTLDSIGGLKYLMDLEAANQTIVQAFARQTAKAKGEWRQEVFEDLLAKWIVSCDQPFDEVEKPEFQTLLDYIHFGTSPNFHIPGRTTVHTRIMRMGQDTVKSVKEMFANLKCRISFSLDAWTSSNQIAFLAIVAHYISNEGKSEELLVDFQEIRGSHSGENMAGIVWRMLKMYGLTDSEKIFAFVMDNATSNDTLMTSLENYFNKHGSNKFDAKIARLRCMPHTIHLAAMKLLESIGAVDSAAATKALSRSGIYQDVVTVPLGTSTDNEATLLDPEEDSDELLGVPEVQVAQAVYKLRRIARAARSSPQRREAWLRTALRDRNPGDVGNDVPLMLILDVKTRWSSTHQMLSCALQYREAIDSFVFAQRHELRSFELTDANWTAIQLVADWLKNFRTATTQMSITKTPMLSQTGAVFRGLQYTLKEALSSLPDGVSPLLEVGLTEAHLKMSEYYEKFDHSPLYTWAALLDPRISYASLELDYEDDATLKVFLEKMKTELSTYFLKHYPPASPIAATSTSLSRTSSSADMLSETESFTARYNRKARVEVDELELYFALPPEDFSTIKPIEWWYGRRFQFPRLHRLALDILAIPGSAVAVERIFSGGRDTISMRHSSLKADTIRNLMLVKQRLRLLRHEVIEIDS